MRTLYESFHIFHFQKRIVSTETIRGNTIYILDLQSLSSSIKEFLLNYPQGYHPGLHFIREYLFPLPHALLGISANQFVRVDSNLHILTQFQYFRPEFPFFIQADAQMQITMPRGLLCVTRLKLRPLKYLVTRQALKNVLYSHLKTYYLLESRNSLYCH